jgi:hypothetical protein
MFWGPAILIPITEVGSVASAAGWLAASAAYYVMRPARGERIVAASGMVVGTGMILMKVVPVLPGHFSRYEWIALVAWISLGVALNKREKVLAQVTVNH